MVTGIVELGIGVLHILVSGVGLNDIHDLIALTIVYVIVDEVMSISIANCFVAISTATRGFPANIRFEDRGNMFITSNDEMKFNYTASSLLILRLISS